MAFQLSPGVRTSEKDLTISVPSVGTSTAGFVGVFAWGPVEELTLVDSETSLVNTFDGPTDTNYKYWFCAGNFFKYSSSMYVVRVVGASAKNAVPTGSVTTVGGNSSSSSSSGTQSSSSSSQSSTTMSSNSSSSSLSSSSSGDSSSSSSEGDDAVLVKNYTHYQTLTGLKQGVIAKYPGIKGNSLFVGYADSRTFEGWKVTLSGTTYDLAAQFDGAPGTSSYATTQGGLYDEMHVIVLDKDGKITGTAGTILEKYAYVSKAKDARSADGSSIYYKNVLNEQSQYVWWASHPTAGTNWGSAASTTFARLTTPVAYSLSGGTGDDSNVTNGILNTGWNLFSSSEDVDVSLLIGGPVGETVAENLITLIEARNDCFGILSVEESDVVNVTSQSTAASNVTGYRDTLPSTSWACLSSSWKYQYDRFNDVYRWVPECGDVAGLMAKVDNEFETWYSPAGFNRGQIRDVIKLAFNPNKTYRDALYKKGVNPIVSFPGRGTVLFGDRTLLDRPSAFQEIGIRRLFIVLRKSISRAADFSLFEFNDSFTRAQFISTVEPFLRRIKDARGISDYRIVCDETNNTADVINRQEFVGDIYVKPNRSINFIQLNFVAVRQGVSFDEIGA